MPLPRSQHCRGWSFQPQRHLTTSAENPPPSKAICEWITSVSNHLLHRCGKYSSRTRHAASALSWTPSNTIWRLALSSRPLTTTSGGPWNSLSFNFFANDGSTPVAFGDLFILDQEYLGTPAALSSSTAGFLAQSTGISSNGYQFDSSITLNSSTQYFFFNGGTQGGDVGFQSPGTLAGGTAYANDGVGGTYQATPNSLEPNAVDVNFRLQGTVAGATVPEPSSLALMTVVRLAAITSRRLRRRRATGASS